MSTRSPDGAAVLAASVEVLPEVGAFCVCEGEVPAAWAIATLLISAKASRTTTVKTNRLRSFMVTLLDSNLAGAISLLRFAVACFLGFCFRHEFSVLGVPVPVPALVIHAAVEVHPHLAAGFGRVDFALRRRAGSSCLGCLGAAFFRRWLGGRRARGCGRCRRRRRRCRRGGSVFFFLALRFLLPGFRSWRRALGSLRGYFCVRDVRGEHRTP